MQLFSHEMWKSGWPQQLYSGHVQFIGTSPLYHTAGGLDARAASQWGDLPVIVVLIRHWGCGEQAREAQSRRISRRGLPASPSQVLGLQG